MVVDAYAGLVFVCWDCWLAFRMAPMEQSLLERTESNPSYPIDVIE